MDSYDYDTEQRLEETINDAVSCVKAWDGRKGWRIETDWLDDECFVINFMPGDLCEFQDRGTAEQYARPLLRTLGEISARILNEARKFDGRDEGEWVDYSDLNYWDKEGNNDHADDWDLMQVEVRFDF